MSLLQTSSPDYFVVSQKNGLSQFQTMTAYLGGSAFQTVLDNPVTAYRQLVQQFAKDAAGNVVDPRVAASEATAVFKANPAAAALSGLVPRIIGVGSSAFPSSESSLAYPSSWERMEPFQPRQPLGLPFYRLRSSILTV